MGGPLSPAICLPWCAFATVLGCLAGRLACACWPPGESGRPRGALQPLLAEAQPPVPTPSKD